MAHTPCEIRNEFHDDQGRYYTRPFSEDPTSEMCRLCEEPEEGSYPDEP